MAKNWNEKDVDNALNEVQAGLMSVRGAALKYGIPETILRRRKNEIPDFPITSITGRKQELSWEVEGALADCIGILCKHGFSPSIDDILNLVQENLEANNIKTSFVNNRPGRRWLDGFVKRNSLSLKKANMITKTRKSATSNPFIIYQFYDMLEEVVRLNNIGPNQIWNCDETGFPHDPTSCRVVGPRGKVSYKVTAGPGRQNTTVLASCSAAGDVFPPLIVFQGKNFQSSWKGKFL